MLEMARDQQVEVQQDEVFGPILLSTKSTTAY